MITEDTINSLEETGNITMSMYNSHANRYVSNQTRLDTNNNRMLGNMNVESDENTTPIISPSELSFTNR